MLAHQASQLGVLELFGTPKGGDGIRLFTKGFAVSADGGMNIKQRAVGIEDTVGERRMHHGISHVSRFWRWDQEPFLRKLLRSQSYS